MKNINKTTTNNKPLVNNLSLSTSKSRAILKKMVPKVQVMSTTSLTVLTLSDCQNKQGLLDILDTLRKGGSQQVIFQFKRDARVYQSAYQVTRKETGGIEGWQVEQTITSTHSHSQKYTVKARGHKSNQASGSEFELRPIKASSGIEQQDEASFMDNVNTEPQATVKSKPQASTSTSELLHFKDETDAIKTILKELNSGSDWAGFLKKKLPVKAPETINKASILALPIEHQRDLFKHAISTNNMVLMEAVLDNPAFSSAQIEDHPGQYRQKTAMHSAVTAGSVKMVELLLSKNCSVHHYCDLSSYTPLELAVSLGNSLIVEKLLTGNTQNINEVEAHLWLNPLAIAAKTGNIKIAEILIKHGAFPDITTDLSPSTILMLAISCKNFEFAIWFVDKTGLVNHKNPRGSGNWATATALDYAAHYKQPELVEALLKNGAEPRQCKTRIFAKLGWGKTDFEALTLASKQGYRHTIKHLTGRDYPNSTADIAELKLHVLASSEERSEELQCYLVEGVNLSFQNKSGETPLHVAISKGNVEAVKLLVEKGAAINTTPNYLGLTPLQLAVFMGNEVIVSELLKTKIPFHGKQLKNSAPPIKMAILYDQTEILSLLLESGENPDIHCGLPCSTPLMLAIDNRKKDAAKLLIEYSRDLNIKNPATSLEDSFVHASSTALDYAAHEKWTDIVELLLAKGASLSACRTKPFHLLGWGNTLLSGYSNTKALKYAFEHRRKYPNSLTALLGRPLPDGEKSIPELELHDLCASQKNPSDLAIVLTELKLRNCNFAFKNSNGDTALHIAIARGNITLIGELLKADKDVIIVKNDKGITPLQLAIEANNADVLEALLKEDTCDLNQPINTNGHSPLVIAILNNAPYKVLNCLVKHGADINYCCGRRLNSPLMIAARGNRYSMMLWLLQHPVKTSIKNNQGNPILHYLMSFSDITADTYSLILHSGIDLDLENNDLQTAAAYAKAKANRIAEYQIHLELHRRSLRQYKTPNKQDEIATADKFKSSFNEGSGFVEIEPHEPTQATTVTN